MASASFDVFDQATLTGVINRPLVARIESDPTVGEQIAPTFDVQSRSVSVQAREVEAFGVGQFRAPGATPALTEFAAQYSETVIELALLDEMNRIKDEDWLNLQSPDDAVRRKAGVSIVDRGNALAIRNRRLSEKLRWDAFSGEAVITYPNGSEIRIDYGIDNTPSASDDSGVTWDQTQSSDPISQLKAWQKLPASAVGEFGTRIHLSSDTLELLLESQSIADMLTGTDRGLTVVKEADVLALLRNGTEFVVTDAGYRDVGVGTDRGIDSITPYLPKGIVLITTPYVVDGQNIADMPDGQVIVSTGYNQAAVRQGAQSEVILEHISKTHFLRYASARIPRINVPGAFVYADVLN